MSNCSFTYQSIGQIRSSILMFLVLTSWICAQDATVPGAVTTPYPTVINLAVEWAITGDDNLNGQVAVRYRVEGTADWADAMPLRRVPAGTNLGFSWENKHSGSIFDLRPGTAYEIELTLEDPDGGGEQRTVTAATRPAPVIPDGAIITEIPAGTYGALETVSGTEAQPRVYRPEPGAAVTYDFINLQDRQWVYIWGFTVNSTGDISSRAIRMDGAANCVVRHCTLSGLLGITAYAPGMTNCYIGDNVVTGTTGWSDAAMGANGDNAGEGIQFTGSGNVIAFNRVTGFRDCISTMEDAGATEQIGIDIYNNDIFTGADDGIEADFCFHNCRIMRNRITNSYVGLSSQPGLGGPNYFIRNVMYNTIHAMFKFKRDSRGDVALHNTAVKVGAGLGGNSAMDHAFFRNNLAFGGPDGGVLWGGYGAGNPYAADIADPGVHSSFDYDAVGTFESPYIAKIGGAPFGDAEPNGVEDIDMAEIFPGLGFPNPPVPERDAEDLMPAANSAVVDAALLIPNINDHYLGEGPDIGAYEAGQDVPVYGPRSEGVDEGTASKRVPDRNIRKPGGGIAIAQGPGVLAFAVENTEGGRFTVEDISGRVLMEYSTGRKEKARWRVDTRPNRALEPGVYLVRFSDAERRIAAGRFIIQ